MQTHLVKGVVQEAVEEAGKVSVEALVAGDELVGEGEPRHEQPLLQPEDGAEGATEMDALHARKCDQPLGKAATAANPPLSPLRLLCHTWHSLDRLRTTELIPFSLPVYWGVPTRSFTVGCVAVYQQQRNLSRTHFGLSCKRFEQQLKRHIDSSTLHLRSVWAGHSRGN